MYPYRIITLPDGSGIYLYEIFILIGVLSAIIMCRVLADRRRMPAKLQNLILIGAVVAVVIGYLSAVLWQAVYNAIETGKFELNSGTGATFYGGLIGGAVCMLLIYFIGGKLLFKNTNEHLQWFSTFANIAGICIPLAHGFGRIGCLMAGCCHGAETNSWIGMSQYIEIAQGQYAWRKVVPVQLFEAIFLFLLAAALIWMFWKGKGFELPIYFAGYGIWRFVIEYFRADDRGATFISFLSPSQLTAVVMILIAAAIFISYYVLLKKKGKDIFKAPVAEKPAEAASQSGKEDPESDSETIQSRDDQGK